MTEIVTEEPRCRSSANLKWLSGEFVAVEHTCGVHFRGAEEVDPEFYQQIMYVERVLR